MGITNDTTLRIWPEERVEKLSKKDQKIAHEAVLKAHKETLAKVKAYQKREIKKATAGIMKSLFEKVEMTKPVEIPADIPRIGKKTG